MWILILTLVANSSSSGMTIGNGGSYSTEAACLAAATVWQREVRKTGDFRLPIAVCAKTT